MGYKTRYSLSVYAKEATLKPAEMDTVIEKLRAQDEDARYALYNNGDSQTECKWYAHEKAMRAISKAYPDVVFELEGIGEEQPDMWRKYFYRGLMQDVKAVITYESFNPDLLK